MSGFLVQYYTTNSQIKHKPADKVKGKQSVITYDNILTHLKCQLNSCMPVRGSPNTTGITNYLDFISRHDVLNPMTTCLCINPNMVASELSSC